MMRSKQVTKVLSEGMLIEYDVEKIDDLGKDMLIKHDVEAVGNSGML